MVFTHNVFFGKQGKRHGTQQKFYWFFVQTMLFSASSFISRRKLTHTHTQRIQQMTLKSILWFEIVYKCCLLCAVRFRQQWYNIFIASLKWTNVAIVTGMRRTSTLTNPCYAWFCSNFFIIINILSIDFEFFGLRVFFFFLSLWRTE